MAIMGKNGAGKSSMMRLLAGIERPDRGQVLRDTRTSWPMGFSGGFNGTMTGLENVRFVARLYGQDTERSQLMSRSLPISATRCACRSGPTPVA